MFGAEIKKLKSKGPNENCIQPETFYEHFKKLYLTGEIFESDEIENHLQQSSEISEVSEGALSNSITVDEVRYGISKLKRNKSVEIDLLIPTSFIVSKDVITPLLCKLFNLMYGRCIYPDSWSRGIIVPVPKKGDLKDVLITKEALLWQVYFLRFSLTY